MPKITARRANIILLALVLVVGTGNLWATHDEVGAQAAQQHAFQAAEKRQQEASARAGVLIVHKLCVSFGKLAAEKPPAGNPATNPSRAFDQGQHAVLVGLGSDLGCRS